MRHKTLVCEFRYGKWTDQKAICNRVAAIISTKGHYEPWFDERIGAWQIDFDWWGRFNTNDRVELYTRHPHTMANMQCNSLWQIIEWVFNNGSAEKPGTFIDDVLAGRATLDQVDAYITQWHMQPRLYEHLGMTEEEYARFVENHSVLPEIVEAHRVKKGEIHAG